MLPPSSRWPRSPLRLYQADSTILLLGLDGAGKKTLGIIAAIALHRQYVDFNRYFIRETGSTPNEYIAAHGISPYHEIVPKLLQKILDKHNLNCVIGGLPPSGVKAQRDILKSFSSTNPVIYIQRDRSDLEKFTPTSEKVDRLYTALDAFYRGCSNFDYYNITQHGSNHLPSEDTLKLKQVETDFVRFLYRILGKKLCLSHSKDPFTASYTYALQATLKDMEKGISVIDLECGADAINLLVPCDTIMLQVRVPKQIAMLRKMTKLPIILDIINTEEPTYTTALRLGLRMAPDAMTVNVSGHLEEMEAINSIKGNVKMVGTFNHNKTWKDFQTSEEFFKLQCTAARLSMHALRISAVASSRDDNMDCSEFSHAMVRTFNIPITAYNTGFLGRTSICFNMTLSPVNLASVDNGVTVKQARSARTLSFMLQPLHFRVVGANVSYSLAPAMHNAAYEVCGMPHMCEIQQVKAIKDVEPFLDRDCGGFTVTMPFKSQVLSLLDYVSPEARQIGAVNTVVVEYETGLRILKGYNTDHVGVRECIINNLSPANSVRATSTALVLGAGGMARAAIHALTTLGVKSVCIYNRTPARAKELADQYSSLRVIGLEDVWPTDLEQPTIVISAIPPCLNDGTTAHDLTIPANWLKSSSGGTFVELAYKPLETRFMTQIRQINRWIVVDGLSVLLEQGVAQFELFTGTPAPINVMRNALRSQSGLITDSLDSNHVSNG